MDTTHQPGPSRTSDRRLLVPIPVAAALLSISRSSAYSLARAGRLPGLVRLGGSLRVSVTGMEAWIETAQREAAQVGDLEVGQ